MAPNRWIRDCLGGIYVVPTMTCTANDAMVVPVRLAALGIAPASRPHWPRLGACTSAPSSTDQLAARFANACDWCRFAGRDRLAKLQRDPCAQGGRHTLAEQTGIITE